MMREKFELACKIVGLVLFVSSIFVLFSGLLFIIGYDTIETTPPSTRALMTQSQIVELQNMSNSFRNVSCLIISLGGILGMLLGFYLMKSNNLFIKLCYPIDKQNISVAPPGIQLDVKTNESQTELKESSVDKYAPPGYFKT